MNFKNIPFIITDWSNVSPEEHKGFSGTSYWKIFEKDDIRVRMVEYSPNFQSDHLCERGHIVLVLEGKVTIEFKNGEKYFVKNGRSLCIPDDNQNPHSISSKSGAKVFIVD
ncbi:MAG: DHCW motif cupin fold protein [Ignavibacteriales bacterium]|nr:DHCW motif cupin fold protein [Ignavibacteriales bacterium]